MPVCACEVPLVGVGLGAVCAACPFIFVSPWSRKDVPAAWGLPEARRGQLRVANLLSSGWVGGGAELQRTKGRSATERDMGPMRPDLPVSGDRATFCCKTPGF